MVGSGSALTEKPLLSKYMKLLVLIFYLAMNLAYLGWRTFWTLPLTCGWVSIIAGFTLLWAEGFGFLEMTLFYLAIFRVEKSSIPSYVGNYPDVDVLIATYNEPLDLLYKTINGCLNMKYPNKERVHICVCDDGERSELEQMCLRLGVNYITRTDHKHAKAGNFNHALTYIHSPYLVTLDADMIPHRNFLLHTIPFFLNDPKMGFVQTPQSFYNPDPFQYNLFQEHRIPNEQDMFFHLIQPGRSKHNATIYAGSNTVISRKALNEIGGFVTGTITEDIATGMIIQSRGYRGIYHDEILASGLSPENLVDLYHQRIRWGRGVVQTFKTYHPWRLPGLTFVQKLLYSSTLSYWYSGIGRAIYLLAPILYSVFGVVILRASVYALLIIWLPIFVLSFLVFRLFTGGVRTTTWSHIYDTILFPHVTRGVLLETFGFTLSKFKVTPKDSITRLRFVGQWRLVWVQIILACFSLTGIIRIIIDYLCNGFSSAYAINLFWLLYNFFILIIAIIFASERPKFRQAERFPIKAVVKVDDGNKTFLGYSQDISETGLSLIFSDPIYIDPDAVLTLKISERDYLTEFQAVVINVDRLSSKAYKYAFQIIAFEEINYRSLLHILYDRKPMLPDRHQGKLLPNIIGQNLKKRTTFHTAMNRKLPRIPINRRFIAYVGENIHLVWVLDFNYRYLTIQTKHGFQEVNLLFQEDNRIFLECKLVRMLDEKPRGKCIYLYEIINYKDALECPLSWTNPKRKFLRKKKYNSYSGKLTG